MISIRIMGDKELAEEIADIVVNALQEQLETTVRFHAYPVYKDKRKRTKIDSSKIRLYTTVRLKE